MKSNFSGPLRSVRLAAVCALATSFIVVACGGSSNTDGDPAGAGTGGTGIGVSGRGGSGTAAAGSGSAAEAGQGSGASGGSTGTGGSVGVGGTGSGGVSTGGTTSTGGTAGLTSLCEGDCVCANGLDDDNDGLVDGFDPECIGPYDNDEGSFATGIPGDNQDPKWQDCFFDGNSGAGDDDCRYATACLYGDLEQDDADCTVTDTCIDYCGARTPNGCDCFGCCTVETAGGNTLDIYTIATCSLENIDDEEACPRCTKSDQCGNECGECELCPGKTVEDLPEHCGEDPPDGSGGAPGGTGGTDGAGGDGSVPPPPPYTCDNGAQVCTPEITCPATHYCQLGCCTESPVR